MTAELVCPDIQTEQPGIMTLELVFTDWTARNDDSSTRVYRQDSLEL